MLVGTHIERKTRYNYLGLQPETHENTKEIWFDSLCIKENEIRCYLCQSDRTRNDYS